MFDCVAFGNSKSETTALSLGGEERCVGSFVDSVHIEVGGPSGEEDVNTIDYVEETSDGRVASFEFGDLSV